MIINDTWAIQVCLLGQVTWRFQESNVLKRKRKKKY
jgi:hypothetical protein